MPNFLKKYIGDKAFYGMVLSILVPIVIQNGITNFVNLVDNIMVGQLGTEEMSGVAIVNQLNFVFMLAMFGTTAMASIYAAQFFGKGDLEGFRNTVRFKWWSCLLLTLGAMAFFLLFGADLISLFLTEDGVNDLALTHSSSMAYMLIMLAGMIPFAISQIYSSTLRETGETFLPMVAGIIAVLVNMVLDYCLIFGKMGLPQWGVQGAAIATVIARIVEMGIVIVFTHKEPDRYPFMKGLYRTIRVPWNLAGQIVRRGIPLLCNEILWAGGISVIAQCYSTRGIDTVAAYNIAITVTQVFNVAFIAFGTSIGIIVGQQLGSGQMNKARDTVRKLIFMSVATCAIIGFIMIFIAPVFPQLYNTDANVKQTARDMLWISAAFMPVGAFYNASYFTIRSGGKTVLTFFFDSGFMWCAIIPIAFYLSHYTAMNVVIMYLTVNAMDLFKVALGYVLLKKGIWMSNIIDDL